MSRIPVRGSLVALVTPFHEDGSVNFEKLGELIDFHLENETDALVILGTTGESSTMSHEEDNAVCEYTVKRVAGRIPVICGSGSNDTRTMLEKSLSFERLGADGLLIITPYYNKANEEGIYRHFATVADAVKIPCILYNVPGRTGCSISEANVARLSKHPNIIGIKEASGNISYAAKIARYLSDDFVMYSGNDDMIVPMLALGASGVISVLANVAPRETHRMVTDFLEGRVKEARDLQLKLLEVTNDLFIEVNPIPVKEALNLMGKDVGGYRLPLCPMTEAHRETLRRSMAAAGLI
ncbi:4-hydroxy-tetrahydrodipicolinate synthase [Sutterella faecalis]|uniref:4-hydroxy-tetrahydrodipicolinate synthase n=2 Tax=Sutterella TaxID=40544 RepID=A0AAI9SBY3_9BURK|nr:MULTISPECIES: 4-hydroxy-tetrahydrodipicolinate synthase [Sutterella]KAB7650687.1 4-hydroxy-tetrahydrodipicolinate synthase [Sutterella seckii]QDA53582.1 4-hydroxy-tetrahydrodipicolinate synthase [Sutterella faecalis]